MDKYKSYIDYVNRVQTHDTNFNVSEFTFDINGEEVGISKPDNYDDIIQSLQTKLNDKLDTNQFKDEGLLLAIDNVLEIGEVHQLGEHFSKELSEKLYGSEVFVDHVHTYKNKITKSAEKSSWLWHYDDVAPGHIKVMFYLTSTTKDNGAFLVLKSDNDYKLMNSSKISPTKTERKTFPKSRIPIKYIDKLKSEGYYEQHVEGEQGTFILFNHNIIHKATKPIKTPERICMIFIFRPYHRKLDKHIGVDMTHQWGSGTSKKYNYETSLG